MFAATCWAVLAVLCAQYHVNCYGAVLEGAAFEREGHAVARSRAAFAPQRRMMRAEGIDQQPALQVIDSSALSEKPAAKKSAKPIKHGSVALKRRASKGHKKLAKKTVATKEHKRIAKKPAAKKAKPVKQRPPESPARAEAEEEQRLKVAMNSPMSKHSRPDAQSTDTAGADTADQSAAAQDASEDEQIPESHPMQSRIVRLTTSKPTISLDSFSRDPKEPLPENNAVGNRENSASAKHGLSGKAKPLNNKKSPAKKSASKTEERHAAEKAADQKESKEPAEPKPELKVAPHSANKTSKRKERHTAEKAADQKESKEPAVPKSDMKVAPHSANKTSKRKEKHAAKKAAVQKESKEPAAPPIPDMKVVPHSANKTRTIKRWTQKEKVWHKKKKSALHARPTKVDLAKESLQTHPKFPWKGDPVCEFRHQGNFDTPIRVFVNPDNTRAFVFDLDSQGSQTKLQCHGATPDDCVKPHPELLAKGQLQSCSKLNCVCQPVTLSLDSLFSHYIQKMVRNVGPICSVSGGARILNIGLGGGSVTSYLLDKCAEGTRIVSVEKDPRIIEMATRFFGFFIEAGRNEVENADASDAVAHHAANGLTYNVVLVDCFEAGGIIPESCRDWRFIDGLYKVLDRGGLVVQQVWAPQYKELVTMYQSVFTGTFVRVQPVDPDQNVLVIAQKAPE